MIAPVTPYKKTELLDPQKPISAPAQPMCSLQAQLVLPTACHTAIAALFSLQRKWSLNIETQANTQNLTPYLLHLPDTCHYSLSVHLSLPAYRPLFRKEFGCKNCKKINLKSKYWRSYLHSVSAHKQQKMMTQKTTKLPLLTSWVLVLSLCMWSTCFSASADRLGKSVCCIWTVHLFPFMRWVCISVTQGSGDFLTSMQKYRHFSMSTVLNTKRYIHQPPTTEVCVKKEKKIIHSFRLMHHWFPPVFIDASTLSQRCPLMPSRWDLWAHNEKTL